METVDLLAMSLLCPKGTKEAHSFIMDQVAHANAKPNTLKYGIDRHEGVRIFIPPYEQDRVIMFKDKSGVYVHSDGFCTPMGDDISHEVHQWTEEIA